MPRRRCQVLVHHEAVRALRRAAAEAGATSHLVGGIVRDRLLGLASHDIDAVVEHSGETICRAAAAALDARLVFLGGKAFGAYRLVAESWVLDVWDREGTTLRSDLARRDFTVDALALSLPAGELIDPFGGLADLERRALRATTESSFTGDPLRVLRLPRLLAQLPGFSADPATLELARRSAPDLVGIAAERVRDELTVLFRQPDAQRALAVLAALDLYPGLWQGAPGEHDDSSAAGHAASELAHLGPAALELRQLAGSSRAVSIDHRLARLALTFANLPGKADAARAARERFTAAGYLTKKDAGDLARLVPAEPLPATERDRRRYLHALGALWATALCLAGARAHARGDGATWRQRAEPLLALARTDGATLLDPPRLVDGREASEILGIAPGPELGRVLGELESAQVDGEVRTRDQARAWLRRHGSSRRSS